LGRQGEMYVKISERRSEGEVLESYVTTTRNKAAAFRLIKKALKRHGQPEAITTDGLRSYRAAMSKLGNEEKQEIDRGVNNRGEQRSAAPTTRTGMPRFRRMKTLQKLASVLPTSTTTSTWSATSSIDRQGTPLGRVRRLVDRHGLRFGSKR
jgi:putative transposase